MSKDSSISISSEIKSTENNDKKEGKVKTFFKEHKKAILAGTAIVVSVGGVIFLCRYDNGKIIDEAIKAVKSIKSKPVSIPSDAIYANEVVDILPNIGNPVNAIEPISKAARSPYAGPFEVRQFIRNLPAGQKPSLAKIAEAEALGIILEPNQTIVDPFTKGLSSLVA